MYRECDITFSFIRWPSIKNFLEFLIFPRFYCCLHPLRLKTTFPTHFSLIFRINHVCNAWVRWNRKPPSNLHIACTCRASEQRDQDLRLSCCAWTALWEASSPRCLMTLHESRCSIWWWFYRSSLQECRQCLNNEISTFFYLLERQFRIRAEIDQLFS